jgi:outer membrane lipoprotein SlyB
MSMRHVLFALFDNEQAAEASLRDIKAQPYLADACTVLMHRDEFKHGGSPHDAPLSETSAREGLATGALLGTALGGIMGGLVLGPLGFIAAGPLAATLFGALGGGALGALGGGLTGAAEPDPVLEEVRRDLEQGKVLLTVEPTDMEQVNEIERLCIAHGGRIARKPMVGFWTRRFGHKRSAA